MVAMDIPVSDCFAMSRAAATASFMVAVMALASGLRAARLSTCGFFENEIPRPVAARTAAVLP
jgi:hypothetical protein